MARYKLSRRNTFENLKLNGREFHARVLEVYDGDTLTLGFRINGGYWKSPLRIYGIDAPELKPATRGRTKTSLEGEKEAAIRSRDCLRKLVDGKIVRVVIEKKSDKYGRLLGSLYLGKLNVSEYMIGEGHAYRYTGDKKREFEELLKEDC